MLSGNCFGETGIACADEAKDRVSASMITLTTSISRLLTAFVFLCSPRKIVATRSYPRSRRVQC